ncbi:hypothetical protein GL263_06065 [Streptomyces durbertensis]|uniref:DUF3644 domain-containing protein n=1 Tax=Streptomyces durbertensis TaxID=2448886 RepID=A0ABR6ED84_9ACTN|nr:DUF3644 domain-containing protein [Streptomyces durbertensis]MBB1243133.1 hypothetical protein [Streptomyces durbertensis]
MRLRRESRILKDKALASLTNAVTAFNSPQASASRTTVTLMSAQHCFEMLLKGALVQRKVDIFDRNADMSFGFDKCINLCAEKLGVSEQEAGYLRMIAKLRDAEQHWYGVVSEGILYTCMRAAVTLFDELLQRAFGESLAKHLPDRVLPVSTLPPKHIQTLIDEEFTQVRELLQPGKRHGAEARGRIRTLLALQALEVDDLQISERDIDRVEGGIKRGVEPAELIPNLSTIGTEVTGEGINVTVHFTKRGGAPVRWAGGDEAAAAVRTEDPWKKYHWTRGKLGEKLKLSTGHAAALRWHLKIDEDESCHIQRFHNKTRIDGYSDNAFNKMRDAMKEPGFDIRVIYQEYVRRNEGSAGI